MKILPWREDREKRLTYAKQYWKVWYAKNKEKQKEIPFNGDFCFSSWVVGDGCGAGERSSWHCIESEFGSHRLREEIELFPIEVRTKTIRYAMADPATDRLAEGNVISLIHVVRNELAAITYRTEFLASAFPRKGVLTTGWALPHFFLLFKGQVKLLLKYIKIP